MSKALTSWKEIARYLGKGVRTVQRWEAELGLPVRRPKQGERHVVAALPEELDAWIQQALVSRNDLVVRLREENAAVRAENKRLKAENEDLRSKGSSRRDKTP